jgi:hypothetical protein
LPPLLLNQEPNFLRSIKKESQVATTKNYTMATAAKAGFERMMQMLTGFFGVVGEHFAMTKP